MRIGVLGGGASGLAAGAALVRAGAEVVLFEAEHSIGGKLRSFEASGSGDGFRCEDGPNALTANSPTALRIAKAHGLAIAHARAPRTRFVFRRGKLRAAAPPSLAGFLSLRGWARLAVEPLAVRRAASRRQSQQEESLFEFLTRHFGAEAGELGARLMANGVYAGDPRTLSVREAFPRLAAIEQSSPSLFLGAMRRRKSTDAKPEASQEALPPSLWIPAAGMSALAQGLAREVGTGIRTGSSVERIEPRADGYAVAVAGELVRVEGLICTLPPSDAARLFAPIAPGAEALAEIRSSPIAVVHLGFRMADFARQPRGFGLLDGDGSLGLLGVLFPSSLFEGRAPEGNALLTCLVGGMRAPKVLELDDGALVARCCADLRQLLGVAAAPVFQRVARWRQAVVQPEIGHRQRLDKAAAAVSRLPPIEMAGAAWDGVSVEQVLAGGERAAARLRARLGDTRMEA